MPLAILLSMKHFEDIRAMDENDPKDGQKCKIHPRLGIIHRSEYTSDTGLFLHLRGKRDGIQLENGCECTATTVLTIYTVTRYRQFGDEQQCEIPAS